MKSMIRHHLISREQQQTFCNAEMALNSLMPLSQSGKQVMGLMFAAIMRRL